MEKGGNDSVSVMSPTGSGWSLIDAKSSSAWGETGTLYRQSVVEDTSYYELNISAGTALSAVASAIDIVITRGGLTTLLRTLTYSIGGAVIDDPIVGPLDATRYQDNYEVYSQNELGLSTYKYRVVANHNGATATVFDGGDTRTNNEMLDAGIYNVIIFNT